MRYFLTLLLFISVVSGGHFFTIACAQETQQYEETNISESETEIESETESELKKELLLTDRPLEIWTFIDDYRIITGKTLHLTVQVLWKLGITVNLENLANVDLSPFVIEGIIIGERQIFDNVHDFAVITYALSLPSDIKEGIYSIPSFNLPYINTIDSTEGAVSSAPIAVKKVPVLVEGKIDKDVICIGDRITYTLTIRHETNIKLVWDNLDKMQFPPFEVLDKKATTQTDAKITTMVIDYTLAMYELGGKKRNPEIPGLSVLYYKEPESHSNGAASENSDTSIITKEAHTAPISILINTLLKSVDVPLEGLKGPILYSKKHVFSHGYVPFGGGILLLFLFGILTIRASVKKYAEKKPETIVITPQIALEELKNAIVKLEYTSNDTTNRENIQIANKALRTYLSTLIGISEELAQSLTTSRFFENNRQNRLSEDMANMAKKSFNLLDSLIFGKQINKETFKKMRIGLEEIVRLTEQVV
ncbi:MAG: protein BatD [Candidatus Kuenenia sp.]|nr:protein BatD [Candidatus Kuenenia hertensis]